MRIELRFIIQKEEFPLDYRRVFISFLKASLTKCDKKYLEKYYTPACEKEFSFAVFFEDPQFLADKIQLNGNKVKMVFTTADKLTGFIFYSAFLEQRNSKIPLQNDNEIKLIKVTELKQQKVTAKQALFSISSPLCIRKHNAETGKDYYYSYVHQEFEEVFLLVVKNQLKQAGFTENYLEGLHIEPISCKKVIVKHYEYKIECTLGKIMLEGNPVILQYLLAAGVGSRKSAGFGMLDLLANG